MSSFRDEFPLLIRAGAAWPKLHRRPGGGQTAAVDADSAGLFDRMCTCCF